MARDMTAQDWREVDNTVETLSEQGSEFYGNIWLALRDKMGEEFPRRAYHEVINGLRRRGVAVITGD